MVRSKVTNSSFPNLKFDASNIRIRETLERLPKSDRRLPAVIPIDPDLLWPAVQSGENPDKAGYWRIPGIGREKPCGTLPEHLNPLPVRVAYMKTANLE